MNEEKKTGSKLDKLIMGVILGGAIGSVLGLTLAPRKGKETREIIKQKGQEYYEKGKEVSGKIIRDNQEIIKGARFQLSKGKSIFKWLFKKNKTKEPMPKATIDSSEL